MLLQAFPAGFGPLLFAVGIVGSGFLDNGVADAITEDVVIDFCLIGNVHAAFQN